MSPLPWDSPETTRWRALPMHSVVRPTADRLPLDGSWRFQLLPTPQAPLADRWTRLDVPGCWTMQDFDDLHGVGDLPQYTNVQMPWPELPPHVPAANPTGVHERDFDIPGEWAGRRIVLHIGAAESVVIAEVNGIPVGHGKDSHLAGATPYASPSSNGPTPPIWRTRTSGGTAASPARSSSTRPIRCTWPM
jgi:beta-galactosidase